MEKSLTEGEDLECIHPPESSKTTTSSGPPAVIIFDPTTAGLRIAALSLLDRLLVAAHRAGCSSITVVSDGPLPPVPRAKAWRIPWTVAREIPSLDGPVLIARSNVLVRAVDLSVLIGATRDTQLLAAEGVPLPVGMIHGPGPDWERRLAGAAGVRAETVACPVKDEAGARHAERALWDSLTSSGDGLVDRHFNRPVGRLLFKWLIRTPVTPNMISVAATILGVIAGAMFAVGRNEWFIAAALLFQFSAIVDCVDGDVARAVFKESPLGKWLDLIGDQIVHGAVFAGIAVGLYVGGKGGTRELVLGGTAVVGAVLSFAMVLRARGAATPDAEGRRLSRFLDAAANRDFSVVVLALALAGRLDWFLWLAAFGSHAFWILILWMQASASSNRQEATAR